MLAEHETKEYLLNLSQKALTYANTKEITAAEVFFHLKKRIQVLTEGQSISSERSTSELGFAIRILNNEAEGFSYTNKIDKKALYSCVDEAVKISRVTPPNPGIQFAVPTEYPLIEGLYTSSVADVTIEELINNAKIILQPMKDAEVNVNTNLSRLEVREEAYGIVNSLGVESYSRSNQIEGFFLSVAREGEKVGSFTMNDFFTHDPLSINYEEFGETITAHAIRNLNAITPSSIDSDIVVFSKDGAYYPLLYVITHSIRADSVDQERSLWKDQLSATVAVDNFSLIDDSHNPNAGGGCRPFDDEGNPTRKSSIIKEGILEDFLFDELRAKKMDTTSTGNSWRGLGSERFIQPPNEIFPNAPCILPGDMNTDELFEDIKFGLTFEYFSGSVRVENGMFSGITKGAQLIRNGELAEPLINVSIGGNVFEVLKNIIGLSKQTELASGAFVFGNNIHLSSPLIKAEGINISTQK
jgi:PmbA protein